MGKSCPGSTAKVLFPEYEIELEPEELEAGREKSEAEVMKEYEELLRSGQVTHQNDDGEYDDAILTYCCILSFTPTHTHTSHLFVFLSSSSHIFKYIHIHHAAANF